MEETSSVGESSGTINTPEEDTILTPDNMEYPDPESQEEEEIIEEIDTSAIQKESVQKKEEDNLFASFMLLTFRNPSEGSAEEFQKVLYQKAAAASQAAQATDAPMEIRIPSLRRLQGISRKGFQQELRLLNNTLNMFKLLQKLGIAL